MKVSIAGTGIRQQQPFALPREGFDERATTPADVLAYGGDALKVEVFLVKVKSRA